MMYRICSSEGPYTQHWRFLVPHSHTLDDLGYTTSEISNIWFSEPPGAVACVVLRILGPQACQKHLCQIPHFKKNKAVGVMKTGHA